MKTEKMVQEISEIFAKYADGIINNFERNNEIATLVMEDTANQAEKINSKIYELKKLLKS